MTFKKFSVVSTNETKTEKFINDQLFETLFKKLSLSDQSYIKPKIEPQTLQSIGQIVVKFQRLEYNLKEFIKRLTNINNNDYSDILIASHSFNDLVCIIESVIKSDNYKKRLNFLSENDLKLLFNKIRVAEEIRNQIPHSHWTWGGRLKAKKDGTTVMERYTHEQLNLIGSIICKLDTLCSALRDDIYFQQARDLLISLGRVSEANDLERCLIH